MAVALFWWAALFSNDLLNANQWGWISALSQARRGPKHTSNLGLCNFDCGGAVGVGGGGIMARAPGSPNTRRTNWASEELLLTCIHYYLLTEVLTCYHDDFRTY